MATKRVEEAKAEPAGAANRRMSATAEWATYSRIITPELAGASARKAFSPVKAGSTSVPSRATDSAAVWNSAARVASRDKPT